MSRPPTHPRRHGPAAWRRTSAAAVAVLTLGASLAACGSDDEPAASKDSTSESADASGSPEATESADPSAEPSDEDSPVDAAAGDEIDTDDFVDIFAAAFEKATTTRMTMTFKGAMRMSAEGVADFSTSPPEMAFRMDNPSTGGDLAMVLSGGSMYVQVAPKQFARYDLSDPTGPVAGLTDQLDPSALVDTFAKALTSATYVGEEDVSGEAMDHYRVGIDTATMLEDSDVPPDTAGLEGESTFELWFDGEGLFRRMKADLGPTAGSFEASYDDWGAPVTITKPPKSQVMEMARPEEPQG